MDESEQIMRRYLLGELSESEQSALEEKYFTDPQVFNQVLKTESELVDAYVRDQLSNETRVRFEQSYMAHPARTERMKFAGALITRLDQKKESVTSSEQPTSRVSWWQRLLASLGGRRPTLKFSMVLATLLIMLGSVWVFVENRRRQREAAQTQAAYEDQQRLDRERSQQATKEGRPPKEEVAANPSPEPSPTPKSNLAPHSVSLALTVGGVRGGDNRQIPTLVIQPDTTQAQLLLNLTENDYSSYRASLQTVAGAEVFSQTNVNPRRSKTGATFVITVPAHELESGDYVLTLRGLSPSGEVEDLSKSLFRVQKK